MSDDKSDSSRAAAVKLAKGFAQVGGELENCPRMAEALRRSGEELSRITNSLPLAIAYVDSNLRYRFTNKAYEEWVQCSRDEITGRHVSEILGEQMYEKIQQRVEAALSGETQTFEATLPYKERGMRDVLVTYSPYIGDWGEVEGFVAFINDVTTRNQTNKALRESEERYRTLYELASDAFLNVLPDGEIIGANIAAADLLGYTVDELIGMTGANDVIAPEVFEETEQAWRQQLEAGGQFLVDTVWVRKDGTRVAVSVSGKPLLVGDQQQLQLIGRDITERKEAEEALRTQQEEQQIILDSVPALIFYKDRENRFLRVNRALVEASGIPREEWEGASAFGLFPNQAEEYWRDDKAVMESGQALREIIEPMETPGGTRWYRTDKMPYRDADGQIVGIIGFSADITESKQAEEALRASEERFRRLYRESPAMLHSIDPKDGRIVGVSDHWLEVLGYERSEVIGRKSVEFLTEESRRYAEEVALPDFWKRGVARDVGYQFVRKDGEIVDILLSAVVEPDKEGYPYRTFAVLTDVTEQKRLEEQLQNAREELEAKVERQMLRKNPYGLTFRELTVLHLVAAGRSDKEIATELVISPLTVQKHVSNILGKMDASSRTEAATRALREGLLD